MANIRAGAGIKQGENKYLIGDEIGSGGFGVVYRAQQVAPVERPIIVKVPQAHVRADAKASKKFEREARILTNVTHPNVVRLLAFWKFADGEMAIVQEEVTDAHPLHTYVTLYPDQAPSLLLQALYGLRAFHQGSSPAVVHRDISPRNLLVDSAGNLKIIDFGLAKEDPRASQMLTSTGLGAGTVGCMAPEQVRNFAEVDHRADLFGLGRAFAAAIQDRDPQHVSPQDLDEPWKTICSTLTEYKPDARYSDADYAVGEVMRLFGENFTKVTHFERHIEEMRRVPSTPTAWPKLCAQYFGGIEIEENELRLLSELDGTVFASADFATVDFFDYLENMDTVEVIACGFASYESADPLGDVYAAIFPHLDPARKKACLKRLVRAAVSQHRYHAMGSVRRVFQEERDDEVTAMMTAVLNEHDPEAIIEGRSVIPGR